MRNEHNREACGRKKAGERENNRVLRWFDHDFESLDF